MDKILDFNKFKKCKKQGNKTLPLIMKDIEDTYSLIQAKAGRGLFYGIDIPTLDANLNKLKFIDKKKARQIKLKVSKSQDFAHYNVLEMIINDCRKDYLLAECCKVELKVIIEGEGYVTLDQVFRFIPSI